MQRAYGILEFRSIDDEERIIEGIASTDMLDDYGTVLEPSGARFSLPLPLLWQHDRDIPVGEVLSAEIVGNQIRVRAQIRKINEPGPVKDGVDRAWQNVKHRLVRGFSVGFIPLKQKANRFLEWGWRELSLVTIPANSEATIQFVRSSIAASGEETQSPGVSGTQRIPSSIPKRNMTTTEQIQSLEARRTAIQERQDALMSAATAEGRPLSDEENTEYEALDAEAGTVERDVARLNTRAAANRAAATPVNGSNPAAASASRGAEATQTRPAVADVRSRADAEPGVPMARVVRAIALAHRRHKDPEVVARELYPDDTLIRAAVAAHTTSDTAALVSDEGGVYADFAEYLRPRTIIGQFGADGVPDVRNVPFRTPLITQTGGGDGYWVGEGAAKPLTRFAWSRTTLEPLKVANIAVITDELLRSSSPNADRMIRDSLVDALRERLDTDFINPAKAAVAGISPASITNGITAIISSGTDEAAVRADVRALFGAFINADNPPTSGVWIMPATTALALSLMTTVGGDPAFPGITMEGGRLFGLPVILSQYVPTNYDPDAAGAAVAGAVVVLANASDIYVADEGGFAVDASREASLQMDDAPTGSSATPTASTLVSMFQTNSVALRAERTINWARRRESGVAVLASVNWA